MTFSRTTRRWITPAVLAGYVLVITFSGLFHQHGEGCCSEAGCSLAAHAGRETEPGEGDHSTCHGHAHAHRHRHHNHSHSHALAGHSHHAAEQAPEKRPARPRSDDPLKHANCAACQLLAELSLSAPAFVIECAGVAVFREPVATEVRIPCVFVASHPARGPPSAS